MIYYVFSGMPLIQAIEILRSNYSTIKSVQLSYGEQVIT